jgi:3-oxoacyl-[acyl-carrier protein] reductase
LSYLRISDPEDYPEPYRSNRGKDASDVLMNIRAALGKAAEMEADLNDHKIVPELFDFAENELGPVDILINNATGWKADTFRLGGEHLTGVGTERVTPETHDQVFNVDARAGALLISEFARRHISRGSKWGRIIGLTSGGHLGFPGEVSYGAAKAALENYTMSAAFELAEFGVTANIVYPPVTDTGWVTDEVRELVEESSELLNIVDPKDVAQVITYLCSDFAQLITANVIHLR